jgi:uncharacterized protein (DUF1778 family)
MDQRLEVEKPEKSVNPYRDRRFEVRFLNGADRQLVSDAAKRAGQTMNGWIVGSLVEAARRVLAAR